MATPAESHSVLPPIAPKDPVARARYVEELRRLYEAGRLEVSFANRPLPDLLLEAVLPGFLASRDR